MNDENREQAGALDEEGFPSFTVAVLDSARAPKPVRRMAESIKQAAGRAPEVTRPGVTSWRVALTGRRVMVTVDFTTSLGGKTKWAGSVLTVDGKRRPLVSGPAEFGQLWHKYEDVRQRPALDPVPAPPPGMTAPPDVTVMREQLTRSLPDGPEPETGYRAGMWLLGVTIAPDTGLRLMFTRHGKRGPWQLSRLQMIARGRDVSAQAGTDLAAALALLAPPPDAGRPPETGGTLSRGARDTGVETRKRVVIREYRRTTVPQRELAEELAAAFEERYRFWVGSR